MDRLPTIEQLIFVRGSHIEVDRVVLEKLLRNFDSNKRISVQVAAGKAGTGKSSHQNAIIKYLCGTLSSYNTTETLFTANSTVLTLTQGVWVCLTPLFDPGHPDTQILVMDLEGMFGIKRGDDEEIKLTLMKIYLFGMLISSVFTLHTGDKPDMTVIEILKKAFEICRIIRSKYDIQPPKMFMLMKDINSQECEVAIEELKFLVEEKMKGYDEELGQLTIKGKEKPPPSFISSYSKDCRELHGNPYLDVISEVIKSAAANPKYDPTSANRPIKINDLCTLVNNVCTLFNEKDFESKVSTEIDYMKYEKMNGIYHKHLNDCVKYLKDKANTESLTTPIEEFKEQLNASVKESLDAFMLDIDESIKTSRLVKDWTLKQKGVFIATTKSLDVTQIFISRKIAEEENEALKKDHEARLEKEKALTEAATRSLENIQRSFDEEVHARTIEKERLEQEWQTRLNELAQKLLEEEERRSLAQKRHGESLRELERKHTEESKSWSQQFEALRRQQDELNEQRIKFEEGTKILADRLYNERSTLNQEIIEGLRQQMQERDASFQRTQQEAQDLHRRQVESLNQQILAARSNKNQSNNNWFGFISGVFTNPLATLATGIVKTILPKI